MEKMKKIDFSIGIYDDISENIKSKIKRESQKCEIYGVGIYSDSIVIENFKTYPMKNAEERIAQVKALKDVDFVFSVSDRDPKKVQEVAEDAYRAYMEENKKKKKQKSIRLVLL